MLELCRFDVFSYGVVFPEQNCKSSLLHFRNNKKFLWVCFVLDRFGCWDICHK